MRSNQRQKNEVSVQLVKLKLSLNYASVNQSQDLMKRLVKKAKDFLFSLFFPVNYGLRMTHC